MRLRVRYAKLGKVRFTSHRDTARIWERAMRRAGLPVAMSAGFTPRPKLGFGLALPTGAESTSEYLDVDLAADPGATGDELVDRLDEALPAGFTPMLVATGDRADGSLQESVTSVTWELRPPDPVADMAGVAARLVAAATLPIERERKGRRSVDDIRPGLVAVTAATDERGDVLVAELATTGRGVRPAELAALAFPDAVPTAVRALRTHQWIEIGGPRRPGTGDASTRREVLALPGTVSAPVSGA